MAPAQRHCDARLEPHDAGSQKDNLWQRVTIALPYLWLLVFFLLPFVIILKISLADPIVAQPPFTPFFDGNGKLSVTANNFLFLLTDKLYVVTYLKSALFIAEKKPRSSDVLKCSLKPLTWRSPSLRNKRLHLNENINQIQIQPGL